MLLFTVVAIGTTNIQQANADKDFDQSVEKCFKKCDKAQARGDQKKADQAVEQFERHSGFEGATCRLP